MDFPITNPIRPGASQNASGISHRFLPRLSRSLGIYLAIMVMAKLLALPAAGISFRWATSSERIYVSGPGSATLSDIKAALPTAPLTLVDPTNMIWHLGADLFVETNAQLKIYGTAIGGDVNELRLKSENTDATNAFVEIRADWGWLDIRHTKITSWDSAVAGPDTEYATYRRAYLRARSKLDPDGVTVYESRMDVINSEICYLGSKNTEAYGLTWKVVDTTAAYIPPGSTNTLFDLVNVYGDILNSAIHHNFFGVYTYGHHGGRWATNEVAYNIAYGFDPHDDSDQLLLEGNYVHHNGWHGIIASKRCDTGVLRGNLVVSNGLDILDPHANGIMLHRSCNDWLIEGNTSIGNLDSGIAIFASDRATIRNNVCLSNANASIRFSVGAEDSWVEGNEFGYSAKYGFYLYEGNDPPEYDDFGGLESGRCNGNVFTNNYVHDYGGEGIKISSSDDNQFLNNTFVAPVTTLRFYGSSNNLVAGNSFPGNTLVKVIGEATNQTLLSFALQPQLYLQLDAFSTAVIRDANGATFDFSNPNLPTTAGPTGSVVTVTLADLGGTTVVHTRDLLVRPEAGAVFSAVSSWETTGALLKTWTSSASVGVAAINFTIGDLAPGTNYAVGAGTPGVTLGHYTASAAGEISVAVSAAQLPLTETNSFTVYPTNPPANLPPVLPELTNVAVVEWTTLTVTNTASDDNLPTNTLTYALLAAPVGATIDTNGVISWTPDETQGPGTNVITTVVTDGELSATNNFAVIVTETNAAPTLALLVDVEMVELTTLTVTNAASDTDFPVSVLTYSLVDAPAGATIDTNGVITWTPDETQGPGTNVITTVVTDGELSVTNSFTVIVTEMNAAPTLAVLADVEIVELTTLTVTNAASDLDFPTNTLTYALLDAPTGAVIDTNGVITWIPDETQGPGTNVITTVVTDGELSATNSFTVIVTETNSAPTLSLLVDVEIVELIALMVTNVASDTDFPVSALTYSLVDAPAGATIDTNGVITWTPDETQGPGTNVIMTVVTDGELSVTNSFIVIVTETNVAPTLAFLADVEIVELTTLTVTNTASDLDFPSNALSYALMDAPVGATIDANGVITWTPDETQGPGTNVITTVVTDGELSATNGFTVIVTETNAAPPLLPLADVEIVELTTLMVTNVASDLDFPTNALTYSLLDAPTGAVIDTNGVITWIPDETQGPGTNVITTVVTDGELSATNSFTVIVTETNAAPTLVVLADVEIVELSTLTVTNTASDTDFPVSALTYSLVDAPAGATIDTNGVITWTPDETQGPGTNIITTVVTDGELSATNSFTVIVTETNAAPTLPLLADVEIVELTTLTVTNVASDTDFPVSALTYSLVDAPAGATIDTNGVITWTPSGEQGPSTNSIVTAVSDGGLSATNSFTVVVTAVAPVWLTIQITAPDTAILSWPATSPGWILQETVSLVPPDWTNTISGGSALSTGGGTNQVIVSPLDGNKFFRLFHP